VGKWRGHICAAIGVMWLSLAVPTSTASDVPGDFMARMIAWDGKYADSYHRTRDSGTLAWGESYVLRAFMSAYHVTKDPYWLGRVCTHADSLIVYAWDHPDTGYYDPAYADGFLGWGTAHYSDQYDEYMVHEGHVMTPVAELVAEVFKDSTLWEEFGGRAQTYMAFLTDHIAAKWLRLWPGTPPASFKWGLTVREWYGLDYAPHNQYAVFGAMLLFMDDVVRTARYAQLKPGDPPTIYRQRAVEMGEYFKRHLLYLPAYDAYSWKYHDNSGAEDASHANLELEFAWWLNERDLVFTDLDMQRFARTLTSIMWNKSLTAPAVNMSTAGTGDWSGTDYLWGWSLFGKFDPLLWRILERYYAAKTGDTSPYGMATVARLQRFRDTFLNHGILVPERLSVIDDGDRVIRPGETARIGVTVRNIGNARDSIIVRISGLDPLVIASGTDSVIAAVDSGAATLVEFVVRAPVDVTTKRVSITARVGSLSVTGQVTVGSPSTVFVEGTPPADDGITHNAFYAALTPPVHRWTWAEGDTFSTAALFRFESVVWRAAWALPTPQQRDTLARFLDMGGNLLITGGGVLPAWITRSPEDSLFFARYFKVTGAVDVHDSLAGLGVSVRPFDPMAFTAMGTSRRYLRSSPVVHFDVLNSFGPPQKQIIFSATDAQFNPKVLPDSIGGVGIDSTYRALLFGWDLDDMSSNTSRTVVTLALTWLRSPTSVRAGEYPRPDAVREIELSVAPNPFNPHTTITARGLKLGEPARISVVNVLGQVCWSTGNPRPGTEWRVMWNGRNLQGEFVGTGTYFVAIEQGDARKATRIQLVR